MRVLLALLIACVLVGTPDGLRDQRVDAAAAQTFTVTGTIVDPAGRGLPGATLELRQGSREVGKTVSDAQGSWKFENVRAGDYEIQATLAGFRTSVVKVALAAAPAQPIRIVLQIGDASELVVVQSAIETVTAVRVPSGIVGGVVGGLPSAPPPPAAGATQSRGYLGGVISHPGYVRDTASYSHIQENTFRDVTVDPLSTFSVDVDTASYANVRRFLNEGHLPPADAVRVEELINYFKYDYPAPRGDAPVSVTTEVGNAPWNPKHKLALVGLRAMPIDQEEVAPRNLTFLLDVSGSMSPENRLPLIKKAMTMLVDTLRPQDRVGIVVYAGHSGVALSPTRGDRKYKIRQALDELRAGGSTNGAAGIQLAYDMATDHFIKGGINRVILATDGDFNVGVTSQDELVRLIEEKRQRGIFLSVLGVGDNNLKDSTMEKLADKGNGNYSYLDSLQEARRVLIAEAGATLVTVAKDVKIQIEFNPKFVSAYRLIGYENRLLRKEDFNNDRKDAGEMGAGHTVTALYELVPPGEPFPAGGVDPLKYQPQPRPEPVVSANATELMTVKVRYKEPRGETSRLLEFPVRNADPSMTANLGFAAAVAGYGMLLRASDYKGSASWPQVLSLAREHRGRDEDGYRAEFIRLADLASALEPKRTTSYQFEPRR